MTPSDRRRRLALFAACWVVYGAHFATNVVREHYPAFALAEHGTLRVDPYLGLHDDIFAIEGRGAFINSNPGASMLGAIPYALLRPLVDVVVARVAAARSARGEPSTADYAHPREDYREFFRKVRAQGLDVRFGMAAAVMQLLLMAPLTAASVIVMADVLARLRFPERSLVPLALLYGFGTPVFFRTGFLNQNVLVAHLAFFSFALLLGRRDAPPSGRAMAGAGSLAGMTILCDYTGIVLVPLLAGYALHRCLGSRALRAALTRLLPMAAGAAVPVAMLLAYQAWAFGSPLWPAQHYMPRAEYGAEGWNGFTGPDPELLQNLFDVRFGLLPAAPLLVVAFAAPLIRRRLAQHLGGAELVLIFSVFSATWVFASSTQFARLQWETGVRYLIPVVPFLFLAAAGVLTILPRGLAWTLGALAVAQSWCLAMVRDDPLSSISAVATGGLQLPWLTTLDRMGLQYGGVARVLASHPSIVIAAVALLLAALCHRAVRDAARSGQQA